MHDSRTCTRCRMDKPLDAFGLKKDRGKMYVNPRCRQCASELAAAWQKANPERAAANRAKWQTEKREDYLRVAYAATSRYLAARAMQTPPWADLVKISDINERPRRDLRRLIDLIGQRAVERELNVHRTTVARWLRGDVHIAGHQHLAIRGLAGDLPGTAGAWTGWRFHDGELIAPGGDRFRPGEVLGLRLQQQRVGALEQENRALRLRVRTLEKTVDLFGPAANQSQTA